MPKMSPGDLKALLAAEKADALSAMSACKLSDERARALDYYLGDMSRDMPAPEGRSKAVSTDVADTIEGLMPALMDIFTSGDEVVRFEPVGPEDVAAAEQETDYVNHVFMQQNPGFMVLYSFIKDALLSKVGIVKVWWESAKRTSARPISTSTTRLRHPRCDRDVEIVEHTERRLRIAKERVAKRPSRFATRSRHRCSTTSPCGPRARYHARAWRPCRRRNSASRGMPARSAMPTTASTMCSSRKPADRAGL